MELPNSVQEIADVIGREAALYLIGQLPRTTRKDKNPKWRAGEQVMLYVPRKLTPDHRLVAILGMDRARQLVESFGGEILYPANCNGIHKRFVRAEVRRMANDNTPRELAQLMGVTERTIRNITRPVAANDNRTPANDA